MIFICEKQALQDAITITQKAITGKSTTPILEGMLVTATNNGVTLTGSDIDVSIQTKIDANVIQQGKVIIDSRIFGEIIKKLPNNEVKIEIIENDTVQITCEKSVFNVVYINSDDYPTLPSVNSDKSIKFQQDILKNMIKGTSFAIAQDETRPILQGVLFQIKDKNINLVALDGYRLAIKSEYVNTDLDLELVIPGKTLNEISKILDDSEELVDISFTNNHVLFDLGDTKVISRLLEGQFINYSSLLPQEYKLLVSADKQKLQNGIERASLMAKESNSYLIKFNIYEDNLVITSNSQLGKVREEVSIQLQGEEIEIAFNSKYLLDVLKNLEDNEIVLEMTSGVSPCVIKSTSGNKYKYLVLPVRIMK